MAMIKRRLIEDLENKRLYDRQVYYAQPLFYMFWVILLLLLGVIPS